LESTAAAAFLDRLPFRWFIVLSGLIVVAAAALRFWACLGDLWLDEIWSLHAVEGLSSPLQVFTTIHHSNNNHLNTLLIYFLGVQTNWTIYRLPSVIAGVATVIVAGHIGYRRGRSEALLAMLLTAFSYVLIHFSSEARGYGLALLFDLVAFDFLESYLDRRSVWKLVGFWLACILSLISHLMFVMVYAAFVVWSAVRLWRARDSWLSFFGRFALCHAVPLAAIALLYVIDIRHMEIGAAPDYQLITVVQETLSLTLGGPEFGPLAGVVSIVACGLLFAGLREVWTENSDECVFYVTVILISPALFVLLVRPDFFAVRYLLGSALFFLILLSRLLATWLRRGTGRQFFALLLLALYLAANGWHTARLLQFGRGGYSEAVRFMAENTVGDTVVVSGDHDFRNAVVVEFYSKSLTPGKRVIYYPIGWPLVNGAEWRILHRGEDEVAPQPVVMDKSGNRYKLVREYPYAGLSGFRWYLYHNSGSAIRRIERR
jgi:hypothetical protein